MPPNHESERRHLHRVAFWTWITIFAFAIVEVAMLFKVGLWFGDWVLKRVCKM